MKRKDIVPQSKTWLGTRFQHQGRIKKSETNKGACDCVGFVGGVAKELGYDFEDVTDYAHSPNAMMFKQKVEEHLDSIPFDEIKPGDVLTFAFDKEPQHIAIVSQVEPYIMIIHAYSVARKVTEHILIDDWKNGKIAKIGSAYRFRDIEEDE